MIIQMQKRLNSQETLPLRHWQQQKCTSNILLRLSPAAVIQWCRHIATSVQRPLLLLLFLIMMTIKSNSTTTNLILSLSLPTNYDTIRVSVRKMGRYRGISRWQHQLQHISTATTTSTTELSDLKATTLADNTYQNNRRPKSVQYEQRYQLLQQSSVLSLAPMMDYTDYHFRHLIRCISSNILLYTEMVAANAICHEYNRMMMTATSSSSAKSIATTNNAITDHYQDSYLKRYLVQGRIHPLEGASVLQLGGSDPQQMYDASKIIMELQNLGYCNYTAINLNCGCPSSKVAGKGCFGAALMNEPQLVNELTSAIYEGSNGMLPVTVKCRIGTDTHHPFNRLTYDTPENTQREYEDLCHFIETVTSNDIVTDFIVHARIAVLQKSYSPADNRKIPPLKYQVVHDLIKDYPQYQFTLNGGINTLQEVQYELQKSQSQSTSLPANTMQGIMVGRALAADPWSFAMTDELLYGVTSSDTTTAIRSNNRLEILQEYGRHADYEEEHAYNGDVQHVRRFIIKAVTSLFAGEMNAKKYRVALDDIARLPKQLKLQGKPLSDQPPISELIINAALQHLSEETLLRSPQDSYDRIITTSHSRSAPAPTTVTSSTGRSASIDEWQVYRKEQEIDNPSSYNDMLTNGIL